MRLYNYCLRCGRRLKTEDARRAGYGKICKERAENRALKKPLI